MNASHPIAAGTTLLLLLTSCGTMNFYKRTASPPKRALALDPANRRTAAYTVGLSYRYATGPEGGAGSGKEYFRDAYQSAGNEVQKQQVRNEIAKDLVALIDENHAYYHDSLRRALTTNSILGDLFKLGFDTAGVITKGERAKTILAALGVGSTGAASSINSRTLQEQTLSALLKAIELRKAREYSAMASKFGNNTFDFSLNDVIVDLGRYWEAGLIGSGLAELDGLASKEANEVEETKGKNAGRPGDEVAKEVLKVLSN